MRNSRRRLLWLPVILVSLSLVAAACGGDDEDASEATSGAVNISGSSTVEPISIRVAELFEDVAPDISVTVDGPGTGDGFKLFCEGETDISDASRQIKDAEKEDLPRQRNQQHHRTQGGRGRNCVDDQRKTTTPSSA